tara:strand:- start:7 stop:1545 length:1539 start_codon:yes stop_codon:yes gene_type:complete
MDYSWYGAGFIRWGFRALNGDVIYAHKIPNNNQNTEAYMRSGNLPARYEVNTIPPSTTATRTFASGDSTLYVADDLSQFPTSGTLRVKQSTSATAGTQEYINYTGKTSFVQDIISTNSGNDTITVSSTTGLTPGGQQTIIFDVPFANVVANKTYFVAAVPSSTTFKITETQGDSTGIALTAQVGSALSPLSRARAGSFTGITREQAGNSSVTLTMADGASSGTVSSATGIQKGQRVIDGEIPSDTFVHSISGTNIVLSKAVNADNPAGVKFPPLGAGSAQTFTYSATQPIGVELIQATSVPQISHWGSSIIMDGEYDEDRAYIYSVGTRTGRTISSGVTKAILGLRLAPTVDNGITGTQLGDRELVNRMQLVMRDCQIVTNGVFFVELVLNPTVTIQAEWEPVGGTSLAQYAELNTNCELVGGEVVYAFYAGDAGGFGAGASTVPLDDVKELSNSVLGGGGTNLVVASGANPTGVFPDGPEVLAVRVTNIAGGFGSGSRSADFKFSWTEAQA